MALPTSPELWKQAEVIASNHVIQLTVRPWYQRLLRHYKTYRKLFGRCRALKYAWKLTWIPAPKHKTFFDRLL